MIDRDSDEVCTESCTETTRECLRDWEESDLTPISNATQLARRDTTLDTKTQDDAMPASTGVVIKKRKNEVASEPSVGELDKQNNVNKKVSDTMLL